MAKLTLCIVTILASMTVVTASPMMNPEMLGTIVTTVSQMLDQLEQKDPSGMVRTFRQSMAPFKDMFLNVMSKMGGGRQKRAIHSDYVATKVNATHYQKVEFHKSVDKDAQEMKAETPCLIKENEVYWLDYMSSVLIGLTQEMKRVIDGKQVPFKMSKNGYEQQKPKA
ncbi:uncharacterized protein LOC109411575 [Aedes albopictus]|uniref:Secreted protein n=1 Tax=Aedes albopictus TaxID=7160 RepID=A0ABM1Z9T7_AEDAL|nr:uncharacterized protein LOC109411575 [Aedes albopictus]